MYVASAKNLYLHWYCQMGLVHTVGGTAGRPVILAGDALQELALASVALLL